MTEKRIGQLKYRLMESRYRISNVDRRFSEPLYRWDFIATKSVWRISTSGKNLYFDPDWLQKLDDEALDFILSHELMHIALGHVDRPKYYRGERYHLAADIVANANLTLLGWQREKMPKIGRIYTETFFPKSDGRTMMSLEAFACVPFDPSDLSESKKRGYMIDSDEYWDKTRVCTDGILILSPQDEIPKGLVSKNTASRFRAPKKEFTDVKGDTFSQGGKNWTDDAPTGKYDTTDKQEDSQGYKSESDSNGVNEQIQMLRDMVKVNNSSQITFAERMWQANDPSTVDWRKLLCDIVQCDVIDYTFSPPDKRFADRDIFLPDYGVVDQKFKEVLFMVDTSGSISRSVLNGVFAELKGAITQFDGALSGILGFFDSFVYPLIPFHSISDLSSAVPVGGGGTDYCELFNYIRKNISPDSISSIVIFTDGQAEFPPIPLNDNIPVLWLFSKANVSAPWGRQATVRI